MAFDPVIRGFLLVTRTGTPRRLPTRRLPARPLAPRPLAPRLLAL